MAKDPAFLFYPNDYLGGTMGMSFELKGAYIELFVLQHNAGVFSEESAINLIGSDRWSKLKHKFKTDGDKFWNQRLLDEISKRKNYSDSRRKNRKNTSYDTTYDTTYVRHMENENENEDEILNKNKDLEKRKKIFIEKCNEYNKGVLSILQLNDFIGYWTEHSENANKMRFEKQPVFDIYRRILTWHKNTNKFINNGKQTNTDAVLKFVSE